MFNTKECKKCGKKIKQTNDFCPYCGKALDEDNSWGMIGKNDFFQEATESDPFSGSLLGGGILDKMLGRAMKMLEKELQKDLTNPKKNPNIQPKTNLQLFINGKKVNLGEMNVGNKNNQQIKKQIKKQIKSLPSTYLSSENSKNFSKFPREEPTTKVRRLSDKIIYEINMPEVKSVKNVSIVSLESSIEIKAVGKSKSYSKVIQIGLPLVDYSLEEGKLILELGNDPAQI